MAFNDTKITANDSTPLNQPVKYSPEVELDFLERTRSKLALARYPEEQEDFGEDDWSQGAKVEEVARLAKHWYNEYDWPSRQVSMWFTIHRAPPADVPLSVSYMTCPTIIWSKSTCLRMALLYCITVIGRAQMQRPFLFSFVMDGLAHSWRRGV